VSDRRRAAALNISPSRFQTQQARRIAAEDLFFLGFS
jgi:hypothetical protein